MVVRETPCRAQNGAFGGVGRLRRLWSGELPLGEAFWTYAFVGGVLVNLATTLALLALVTADRPILALIVGYGFSIPYNLLTVVGVWRSADRHEGVRWQADLIRVVTVIGMIILSLT